MIQDSSVISFLVSLSEMNQNIPKFKILMIGMGGVGKTSYLTRFLTGEFREKYYRT